MCRLASAKEHKKPFPYNAESSETFTIWRNAAEKRAISIFKIFKKKSVAFKVKEEKAPHKKKEFQRDIKIKFSAHKFYTISSTFFFHSCYWQRRAEE